MKTFNIEIVEILSKVVPIEAKDVDEALDIAKRKYQQEDIVLDSSDLVDTEFDIDWKDHTLEYVLDIGTK